MKKLATLYHEYFGLKEQPFQSGNIDGIQKFALLG